MASVLPLSSSPFDLGFCSPVLSFRRSNSSLASARSDSAALACRQQQLPIRSVLTRQTKAQVPVKDISPAQSLAAFEAFQDISPSRLSSCSHSSGSASLTCGDDPLTPVKTREDAHADIQLDEACLPKDLLPDEVWPKGENQPIVAEEAEWIESLPRPCLHQAHQKDINTLNTDTEEHNVQLPAFRRWVSTLRRRRQADENTLRLSDSHAVDPGGAVPLAPRPRSCSHVSSLDFVTGVRAASLATTKLSLPATLVAVSSKSPRSTAQISSDVVSQATSQHSIDSDNASLAQGLDEAALKRSHKRARKIMELVKTEEGYLSDLKCLQNAGRLYFLPYVSDCSQAYFTFLLPHASGLPRIAATQACVSELLQLHEDIFGQLQVIAARLVPCKTVKKLLPSLTNRPRLRVPGMRHVLSDFEPLPQTNNRAIIAGADDFWSDGDESGLVCTTEVATDIALLFLSMIRNFAVYEEYVLRCGLMQLDADLLRTDLDITDQDRALEALQASVRPSKDRGRDFKKALGLKDLLIKPVQRITRYELLLKDLCSLTPSCDDPSAHATLDDTVCILSQTCHDLNQASGSPERLRMINSQRRLQQRLQFNHFTDVTPFDSGRLLLCGTLYVAYSSPASIKGQYAVCVLYESCLLVASIKSPTEYKVLLAISLAHATVEEADNGKALQCHTTPNAWKVVFESDGAVFETLLVACSLIEAETWRHSLLNRISMETEHPSDGSSTLLTIGSPLTTEMRSAGKAYGRTPSFQRRASVQRAATLGPMTALNQVIIKNTQATGKDSTGFSNSLPIERSQSLWTPSHIAVLAPRRSERIHLEAMLVDVWTKDSLPYPGLGPKRGEYSMRASAGHVMRKLSIASITSNFSRLSQASIDDKRTSAKFKVRNTAPVSKPEARPEAKADLQPQERKVINFQTAPDAFLPEDFALQGPAKVRGRLAGLRSFTMGAEKCRAAALFTDGDNADEAATGTALVKRSRSVLMRRRHSELDIQAETPDRSQTSMSTPTVLDLGDYADGGKPLPQDAGKAAARLVGKRQRAKSRLVRMLS